MHNSVKLNIRPTHQATRCKDHLNRQKTSRTYSWHLRTMFHSWNGWRGKSGRWKEAHYISVSMVFERIPVKKGFLWKRKKTISTIVLSMWTTFLWHVVSKSIYTNLMKLESLFVSLNALIFGATSQILKILFAFTSSILEEGFQLYNITLIHLRAEQKVAKSELFSITGKQLIGSRQGFL